MQERIEQAWERCKDWITIYDGSPSDAYFTGIHPDILYSAYTKLRSQTSNFSFSASSGDEHVQERNSDDTQLKKLISKLVDGKFYDMEVFYIVNFEDFDFRVHIIVDITEDHSIELDVIWWADFVFPEGVDKKARFFSIASHFLELETIFQGKCSLI